MPDNVIFNPDHYEREPGDPLTVSGRLILSQYWKDIEPPKLKQEFAALYAPQQAPQQTALVLVPAPKDHAA